MKKHFCAKLAFLVMLGCLSSLGAVAQSLQNDEVPNVEAIAAGQKCQNWCWAASTEMLARSQGLNIPQEEFVRRIYGNPPPCKPSFGSFEPIRQAIAGTYSLPNGETVTLGGAYHYGIPTDVTGMIRSIKEGRPFVFAWKGHALVAYGLVWYRTPYAVQITEIKLIDPFFTFGNPKYTSFVVGRDNFQDINGTFELLVRRP
jgi:hypothetical protein